MKEQSQKKTDKAKQLFMVKGDVFLRYTKKLAYSFSTQKLNHNTFIEIQSAPINSIGEYVLFRMENDNVLNFHVNIDAIMLLIISN